MSETQKEVGETVSTDEPKLSSREIEKMEEAKLRSRFPARPMTGSAFLQNRLAKGQKYFDSGDYQMAKQQKAAVPKPLPSVSSTQPLGTAIPTPESVPVRKTSVAQSKLASPAT